MTQLIPTQPSDIIMTAPLTFALSLSFLLNLILSLCLTATLLSRSRTKSEKRDIESLLIIPSQPNSLYANPNTYHDSPAVANTDHSTTASGSTFHGTPIVAANATYLSPLLLANPTGVTSHTATPEDPDGESVIDMSVNNCYEDLADKTHKVAEDDVYSEVRGTHASS